MLSTDSVDPQAMKTLCGLLQDRKLAVLATSQQDSPYGSLVAFASTDDLRHLMFVTPKNTRKFANLRLNAQVALVITDQNNSPADFEHAAAVTAVGCARVIPKRRDSRFLKAYLRRHEQLQDFVMDPGSALVAVAVTSYHLVCRFQQATQINIS